MKARVKSTGKLLEKVVPIMSVDSKVVMFHEYGTEEEYYYYEDLDFSNTIDWEQIHIQAAIAAMQGMLSSKETMVSITEQARNRNISVQAALATLAVVDADALVAELKEGGLE